LFQGLLEISAILHPAGYIERSLQCLSVFSSDLAEVAPRDESIQTIALAVSKSGRENLPIVDFVF
jgi:hypothetical protein